MDAPRYRTRRELWTHLLVYPGHTLPTAIAPIFVGAGLAIHDGVFAFWPTLAALLCSWMIHVGGVFADNYALLTRHASIREHPELNDSVANGSLKLPVLKAATIGWFAAAFLPGIYLFQVVGWPGLVLGAIGIVASAWYATGSRSMSDLGLSDPIFFVMFGVVGVVGTYYVQAVAHGANPFPGPAFLVGLPVGALVTNVMIIDDIRDVSFDQDKGWKTIAVRFGVEWSRREHLAFTVFAYAMTGAMALSRGPWLLLPWLTLPVAAMAERKVWTAPRREELIPWTPRSAFLSMGFGALLGLGLALGR